MDIEKRMENVFKILESQNSIVLEFFKKGKKEKKKGQTYGNSKVKSDIKGIKAIAKKVAGDFDLDELRIAADSDSFGNYEKGQDFESMDDFLIVRVEGTPKDVKSFTYMLRQGVKEKYPQYEIDVEHGKGEVSIYASLD